MREQSVRALVKKAVSPYLPKAVVRLRRRLAVLAALKPATTRHCPICGFKGYFEHFFGPPFVYEMSCAGCGSHTRHRLFWLWFEGRKDRMDEPILHFAPEALLEGKFRALYDEYRTADLNAKADLKLDIGAIALDSASVSTVICNHVLEHVPDDRRALAELGRILKPGGKLIVSVPLIEGWERTYEDQSITDPALRDLHFGQSDHLRYYGRDFRDRLRETGFLSVEEITAEGGDVVEYGLMRGEKVFICRRD